MFTLFRPVAGVVLAVFGYYAALAYVPVYDPEADLGAFPVWVALMSFVVGYVFLGARVGRALWMSIFAALQAVVLSGVTVAMVMAVREVFIRGYRRMYREPFDAVTGYFDLIVDWLGRALVQEYLILLGIGSAAVGVVLHIVHLAMERRRSAR
jgi:hypothetical protein